MGADLTVTSGRTRSRATILPRRTWIVRALAAVFSHSRPRSSGARTRIMISTVPHGPGASVARAQDAELVALGVGQNDEACAVRLTNVHPPCAQLLEPAYLSRLVVVGSRRQIEMEAVLHILALGDPYECQPRASLLDRDGLALGEGVWGYEHDLIRQVHGHLPAKYRRPPLGLRVDVPAVDNRRVPANAHVTKW